MHDDTMTPAEWDRFNELEALGAANRDANDDLWDNGPGAILNAREKATQPPLSKLQTLDMTAMASATPKPRTWAIEGLAPMGELSLFTGAGSAGKSLLCQQFATAAAAGVDCLGLPIQHLKALYITCEDDGDELHRRQIAIAATLGVHLTDLDGWLFLTTLRGELDNALGKNGENGALVPAPLFNRLASTIRLCGINLVFLDNLAHLFTGNENDRGEVTQFVNLLNRLARDTGAAIVLIGHSNKIGDSYSGSTAWLNAVRSQFTIEHDLKTDFRTVKLGKANYAQRGTDIRFIWRGGAFVHEGDLPPDVAAELTATAKANRENDMFLHCLAIRNQQERPVSESEYSRTFAPLVFAEMAEAKGMKRDQFKAAMDRLYRIRAIDRGVVCRGNGKDREGLVIVAADLPADPPLTLPADLTG